MANSSCSAVVLHATCVVVGFIVMGRGSTFAFVVSPTSAIRHQGLGVCSCSRLYLSANDGEGVDLSGATQETCSHHHDQTNSGAQAHALELNPESVLSLGNRSSRSLLYPFLVGTILNATIPLGKEAARVFHGRGGMYQGYENFTLDWFPPVWVLTSFQGGFSEMELSFFQQELEWSVHRSHPTGELGLDAPQLNLVYQCRSNNGTRSVVVAGDVPDPHVISENGMQFVVQLLKGQNQGIFLDMRNGRDWVRTHAAGRKVLNLFSYTCGFSVAAMVGGATEVVNVDMARGALKVGQRNHELNNVTSGTRFLGHDIFKTWGKIRKLGPYGLIIVDPPSFQRNSFVAKTDYIKVIRRLPDNLLPNGLALLCLNAPELDTYWLKGQVLEAAPELQFKERVTNPISFPAKDQERGLKVLAFQKRSDGG
jgi:23S rRNA (cytosine1962-C5)-methyltransferase